jgi:hypothetical protein
VLASLSADLVLSNLLSPVTLAFVLGLLAVGLRSDLSIPAGATTMMAVYLLLAIGLKGGAALAGVPAADLALPALATLALGIVTPLASYAALRRLGRFGRVDAAVVAAHYGSVSAVTFLAALAYASRLGWATEPYFAGLVAILEVPAILVGLVLAHSGAGGRSTREAIGQVLAGKSVLLLVGGMAIGAAVGPGGLAPVKPFFVDPFHGVLMLFLLDLGLVAGRHLREAGRIPRFLAGFALVAPVVHGALGVIAGRLAGLSVGGCTVLGAMASSASYIAAPAAVRMALPDADPAPSLTAALGITFPFNLTLGIPLYAEIAAWLAA